MKWRLKTIKSRTWFGIAVMVPQGFHYVAADADGSLFCYEQMPVVDGKNGIWSNIEGRNMNLGMVDLGDANWFNSLVDYSAFK